jgi:hypothetical protein
MTHCVVLVYRPSLGVARAYLHRDMQARLARVDEFGAHLDHVADQHGPVETDAAYVNRDAVLCAPPDRASVSGLVDPLRDRAAVHLAAEVYVRPLGQEPQRDFPLPLRQSGGVLPNDSWLRTFPGPPRPSILWIARRETSAEAAASGRRHP